jgi:hypothetical protein
MDVKIFERGVPIVIRGVDEPGAVVAGAFPNQRAHIEDAVRRVPSGHLRAIPPIVIGDRPAAGGRFRRSPCEIGLNRRTFVADHNARYLFTLLHEIGHAVDHANHIVSTFQRETRKTGPDWATYRAIVYLGRNRFPPSDPEAGTPLYGEHFAEGYAKMLTRPAGLTPAQQALIRRLAGL